MNRLVAQRIPKNRRPDRDRCLPQKAALCVALAMAVALLAGGRVRAGNSAQGASAKAEPSPAGNAETGKQVFVSEGCFACHGMQAQGTDRTRPPGVRIGPPTVSFAFFSRYVRQPTGLMPSFQDTKLSDAQLADIYAFLKTVPPPPASDVAPAGNLHTGKTLFDRDGCYECHGTEGQGSLQTRAAQIGPPPIPYSAFAAYVRHPSGTMPPYTSKVVSDAEMADIYAFLKSIPLPPRPASIPLLNE
jgi:mono/diheme cytochrome c family protein